MKYGINAAFHAGSVDIGEFAARCEGLGFESFWLPEHPVVPAYPSVGPGGVVGAPIPDSYTRMVDQIVGLTVAAAATRTIRLATGVCLVPEHHPIDLAKRISTLDLYSGGRFILGVGAGWSPEESAAMGGDFARRWAQAVEAIRVMKTLWAEEEPEFHGEFYDFPPMRFNPKPVRKPHPPVLLGGSSRHVFRRVAAWADGWLPIGISPDDLAAGRKELDRLCAEGGRDGTALEITAYAMPADRDMIRRLKAAGADRVTFAVDPSPEASPLSKLEEIAGVAGL